MFFVCRMIFPKNLFPFIRIYDREKCIGIFKLMMNLRNILFVGHFDSLFVYHGSSDDKNFILRFA